MRPLAYAALALALAGCSLAYRDTSFPAQPGLEAELHGKSERKPGEGRDNDQTVEPKAELRQETGAVQTDNGDVDDSPVAGKRIGSVFPTTAQPAAEPVASEAMQHGVPGVDPDAKPGTNPSGPGMSGETSPNMVPPATNP